MATPDRFYMLRLSETCHTDPVQVWEEEIEPYLDCGDIMANGPREIEERLVEPIDKSIRGAARIVEDIIEWCTDDIGCDYFEAAGFDDLMKDAEVLAVAETLRQTIIGKVRWWSAGAKVGTHEIDIRPDGPCLDGEPLYRSAAKR